MRKKKVEIEMAEEWLKKAKSNLAKAKIGKLSEEILYEDLCYDAQQAAEKSIKALLTSLNIQFPKTHSISELLTLIENAGISVPDKLKEAAILTDYAVSTRYPGDWEPVNERKYIKAVKLAERVYKWTEVKLKNIKDSKMK